MSNGFILSGSIIESLQNGVPLYQIGFLLLPHGIFEIPALLLSGSIGFISLEMIWKLCFANTKGVLLDLFKHMMILTLLIGCLLVTASIIEIYVTPLFK
ncbi:stage II sporulation protein M [Paenibacillus larvae]|nr:stage II sporulation protein M [Paenibacillus larvae]MDT2235246.1 stage II sporulation protein M [Paenibacillus larvae]MDT2239275.1 stage II sporulation protein M [Paenibacillus larvae]MDT2245858.1 stage II sporulation protein M [Paenibacillus larvae]MDT2257308.1 stage II sporulation protein M [Paenibacillus larvae]MDT2259753.1 stage II sporulation protein M [Paenibacillus larvae]